MSRALIRIAGPEGSGKTTFIERVLGAEIAHCISVRATHDPKARRASSASQKTDPEIRRYRAAGASGTAKFRFGAPDVDAFYGADFMEDYSEAVLIEGDDPLGGVDLEVFVLAPPPRGPALLCAGFDDPAAERSANIEELERVLESPAGIAQILGSAFAGALTDTLLQHPRLVEGLRASMRAELDRLRAAPLPEPEERWTLADEARGVERAQLVVVNVHSEAERAAAQSQLEDVVRLRKDDAVYADVMDARSNRIAITAVAANLADPKDAGTKKALARVKRALRLTH